METTYTKSLAGDFGGNINESQLHREIEAAIVAVELIGVNRTEDVVDIIFADVLTGGDDTILNSVIANHVPETGIRKTVFYSYTPKTTKVNNTVYQRVGGPFKYGGAREVGEINQVDVIGNMDVGMTSYSVRLYDAVNEVVIAEVTGLTNTVESIVDLGVISNIPEDETILEIHAKRVGGSAMTSVNVLEVTIYHGNSTF